MDLKELDLIWRDKQDPEKVMQERVERGERGTEDRPLTYIHCYKCDGNLLKCNCWEVE
jgi:hypothetical protein